MSRCPLTGKRYCTCPTSLDDCFACDLKEDYERKKDAEYDRLWDAEYEAYLRSQQEVEKWVE